MVNPSYENIVIFVANLCLKRTKLLEIIGFECFTQFCINVPGHCRFHCEVCGIIIQEHNQACTQRPGGFTECELRSGYVRLKSMSDTKYFEILLWLFLIFLSGVGILS
jgi:hypothetical protein